MSAGLGGSPRSPLVVGRDAGRSAPSGCGCPAPPATSSSPRAVVRPAAERVGDRRRVPLGRVVPRRRRAGARVRRRHALVPGRLDRRLPRPAGAGRRAAAPLGRLHAAGLRRGPARVAVGCAAVSSLLVVAIGWLYLMPQFQGAGLSARLDHRRAALGGRAGGRGRSCWSTCSPAACAASRFVQAFQYWLKLTALLVPVDLPAAVWLGDGGVSPATRGDRWRDAGRRVGRTAGVDRVRTRSTRTYSLIVATFLGTMGLPHVVVRFYTNPDGRAARRTTLVVLALLGAVLPAAAGVRRPRPALRARPVASGRTDTVVLELPARMIGGLGGELLSALTAAGAFAAFLSTSSGLTIAVAGVVSQDVVSRRLRRRSRRSGSRRVIAVVVPLGLAVSAEGVGVARVGRAGVRGRRLDVLPAAGARHLVAPAHRRRRARRARSSAACCPGAAVVLTLRRTCRGPAGSAPCSASPPPGPCRWRSRTMIGGLPAHAVPAARARLAHHGPAAHPRGRRPRPRAAAATDRLGSRDRSSGRLCRTVDRAPPLAARCGRGPAPQRDAASLA